MITVKIPAAIRACSPVALVDPLDTASHLSGRRGTVHARNGNVCSFAIDGVESVVIAGADSLALVISDPTGAAHLAWWLRSAIARISVSSHAEHLAAAGAGQHYSKFLNASSVCTAFWGLVESAALGMPVDDAGLTLLRDYAHHVAGVTNG